MAVFEGCYPPSSILHPLSSCFAFLQTEQGQDQRFLNMQTILGLVEHH
jgi:hypothetical protein